MTSEPFRSPAYRIIAVPFEKIIPNTYNPNSVAFSDDFNNLDTETVDAYEKMKLYLN